MKKPQKAIILAAGLGTRMQPLSFDTPKPLIPLWGRPAIEHIFNLLERWGVRDILVNLHFNPSPLCRYLKENPRPNTKISLSFEPGILGTGGVLRRAAWFTEQEPFWMINSDIATDLSPLPLIKEFRKEKTLAALWMEPSRGPRTVEMRGNVITNFQSSRPGTTGTFTFCGLQLISPAIFDLLPAESFFSIIRVYQDAMRSGWRIRGTSVPSSYWADLGTPELYLKAHAEIRNCFLRKLPGQNLFNSAQEQLTDRLRKRGILIKGFASIDKTAVIKPGARIENSVIWRGAHIGRQGVIENAVIGSNCEITGQVNHVAIRTDKNYYDQQLSIALRQLDLNPADVVMIPFGPRGSARSFTRLTGKGKSWIMIRYSLERTENSLYTQHARFLAGLGLNVPKILADFPQQQFILIEDLGDTSLQRIAAKTSFVNLAGYYRRVLDSIIILHTRGAARALKKKLTTVPPFSPDLYRWEREYFARHFLGPYIKFGNRETIKHNWIPDQVGNDRRSLPSVIPVKTGIQKTVTINFLTAKIMKELAVIGDRLSRERQALIHRDLQSSNIIFYRGKPYFIDFQGMRFGLAAYDLASFLCDPYVCLPLDMQLDLLDYYNRRIDAARRVGTTVFWQATVQRLAQALGAYGFLSSKKGTAGFARYIPPALRMLRRALEQSGICPRLYEAIAAVGIHS
jgi:NDP-sugar pyrophosphorylase family protein/tRNA A-37 threonylcarbamoyl transferase component Bud32